LAKSLHPKASYNHLVLKIGKTLAVLPSIIVILIAPAKMAICSLEKLSLELRRLVILKELMAPWNGDDEMCRKLRAVFD
jgi:hypothetical protein